MQLNVVPAALARLAASLVALFALVLPAAAADRALINMLGYSQDGAYFAFEEFGIQDGSGFAYSTVYVTDLVNDKWTSGTPFEAQADDETTPLADIRAKAMSKAKGTLDKYGIVAPVQIVALIGDGAADNSGKRLSWSTPACCGIGYTQPDAFNLILSEQGIGTDEDYCRDMSPSGFRLTYVDQTGQRVLHEDGDMLPKSRGCALGYRLYAVVQPYEDFWAEGFVDRRVAIVATYPFGFEGVDRRFIAVPIDR